MTSPNPRTVFGIVAFAIININSLQGNLALEELIVEDGVTPLDCARVSPLLLAWHVALPLLPSFVSFILPLCFVNMCKMGYYRLPKDFETLFVC